MRQLGQNEEKSHGLSARERLGKTVLLFIALLIVAGFTLETILAELEDVGPVAKFAMGALVWLGPAWIAWKFHRYQCRRDHNSLT